MTMTPAQPAATPASTRERIIQAAIDLFASQGYGGTSLRHIAEQLGVTKAAVYHHFHTKDDIARVVLGRALDVLAAMTDRLIVAGTDPAAWQRALPQVLDIAFSQRQLLFALERNENTFRERFATDPDLGARLTSDPASLAGLLANPATDPAVRVRLGCAFGSLFGLLFIFSDHYQDIPDDKLRQYLNDAIVTLLKGIRAG
jgi:AcrR family transcriptional regulator